MPKSSVVPEVRRAQRIEKAHWEPELGRVTRMSNRMPAVFPGCVGMKLSAAPTQRANQERAAKALAEATANDCKLTSLGIHIGRGYVECLLKGASASPRGRQKTTQRPPASHPPPPSLSRPVPSPAPVGTPSKKVFGTHKKYLPNCCVPATRLLI